MTLRQVKISWVCTTDGEHEKYYIMLIGKPKGKRRNGY
jgi:hypothetical protein